MRIIPVLANAPWIEFTEVASGHYSLPVHGRPLWVRFTNTYIRSHETHDDKSIE